MIESFCRTEIWKKCNIIAGTPPLAWLKGEERPVWEFENFFKGSSSYSIVWDMGLHRKRASNQTFRYAVGLFARHGDMIAEAWIKDLFNGDWKTAMRKYGNFEEFFSNFEKYFAKRRQAFMDSTTEIIKMFRPDLKNIKPLKTNSHGGVANLLKVLTKTMNEQGAQITSIAKMQYLVATQAGIYIPDEFITDVCVAMTAVPEIVNADKEDNKHV